jgi:hypothetical protein
MCNRLFLTLKRIVGILVRDDDAKHRIKKIVGDKGLVQTIVESKGLEFQDVRVMIVDCTIN